MKFTVKTINSARYEFDVDDDETVENLKQMIYEKTKIDPSRQRLIFLGWYKFSSEIFHFCNMMRMIILRFLSYHMKFSCFFPCLSM